MTTTVWLCEICGELVTDLEQHAGRHNYWIYRKVHPTKPAWPWVHTSSHPNPAAGAKRTST